MRYYQKRGEVAERPHLNLPKGTFEEELGLDGFFGPVAHLYHRQAPTGWKQIAKAGQQWSPVAEVTPDFVKPQCYFPVEKKGSDLLGSRTVYFWNDDVRVSTHVMSESTKTYFRNADGSDLFFVHEGAAVLESPFGTLAVGKGDYVVIPKGVTYRFQTSGAYLLRIESFQTFYKKPETGILGQQALYHEEGVRAPELYRGKMESESKVLIQREGRLTELVYPFDVRDVAGWCGTLYPYALNVKSIAPVLSSIAHLPPSINATFVTHQFIVCTFLPRPLEEPEGALKVPFFHSNIDYDEVIFYHEGNFFSRDNMKAGCMTLHPRGINHGPHPKALANQNQAKRTDEIAVMVDTVKPLKVSKEAAALEYQDYWKSWMKS